MELRYQQGIGHKHEIRNSPPFYHSRYVHLKELRKTTLYFIDKYLGNGPKKKLIDLGCGEMPYRDALDNKLGEYIGVDLPGNPDADFIIDPDSNRCNEINNSSADIVLSIQVLEHVKDPDKYLQEAYRLLKKDGYLILSTHGHWKYHPDPVDYWRWTADGLKESLINNGFKIIEIKGVFGLLPASLQLFQDAVLISFPFVKIWGNVFCSIMQLTIYISNKFVSHSKTLRKHANKDASVFFIIGKKI